jgi:hypothetical protein
MQFVSDPDIVAVSYLFDSRATAHGRAKLTIDIPPQNLLNDLAF